MKKFLTILPLIFCVMFISRVDAYENNYKSCECEHFKINDKVSYSFSWTGGDRTDFVGVVTGIEPKPTNERMHWITIKRISGFGEDGTFSEHFLINLEK